jgi:hypothetical protein
MARDEHLARRQDSSVVRAIRDLRQGAASAGANCLVLDPPAVSGADVQVLGRFYACER